MIFSSCLRIADRREKCKSLQILGGKKLLLSLCLSFCNFVRVIITLIITERRDQDYACPQKGSGMVTILFWVWVIFLLVSRKRESWKIFHMLQQYFIMNTDDTRFFMWYHISVITIIESNYVMFVLAACPVLFYRLKVLRAFCQFFLIFTHITASWIPTESC